jgi:7-carboxy-7-deazaguanine synthase
MTNKYNVVEIFGPTIQGEGCLVGKKVSFVRFWGCDYRCSFCDTKYSYDNKNYKKMSSLDIIKKIKKHRTSTVVLTGGNPCIYDLTELIGVLKEEGFFVCVETQGSIFPIWLNDIDLVVISPKPPSAKTKKFDVENFKAKSKFFKTFIIKPVVDINNKEDMKWLENLYDELGRSVPFYIQLCTYENDTQVSLLQRYKKLVEWVMSKKDWGDVFVLPQLHVLTWGVKSRGV